MIAQSKAWQIAKGVLDNSHEPETLHYLLHYHLTSLGGPVIYSNMSSILLSPPQQAAFRRARDI